MNTNQKIFTTESVVPLNDELVIHLKSKKSFKAVLVAVSIEQYEPNPCNTFIVPLLFNNSDSGNDSEDIFIVPLNDYCPLPEGVINKFPSDDTDDETPFIATPLGIFIILLIITLILCIIILIIFISRKRKHIKETSYKWVKMLLSDAENMKQTEFADLNLQIAALNLKYADQFCGVVDTRGWFFVVG